MAPVGIADTSNRTYLTNSCKTINVISRRVVYRSTDAALRTSVYIGLRTDTCVCCCVPNIRRFTHTDMLVSTLLIPFLTGTSRIVAPVSFWCPKGRCVANIAPGSSIAGASRRTKLTHTIIVVVDVWAISTDAGVSLIGRIGIACADG